MQQQWGGTAASSIVVRLFSKCFTTAGTTITTRKWHRTICNHKQDENWKKTKMHSRDCISLHVSGVWLGGHRWKGLGGLADVLALPNATRSKFQFVTLRWAISLRRICQKRISLDTVGTDSVAREWSCPVLLWGIVKSIHGSLFLPRLSRGNSTKSLTIVGASYI